MTLHPSDRRLNQFADGEVSAKWQRARISRHLQACAECRNTVMAIRDLGRDAKAREVPQLPEELRDRVLTAAAQRAPAIVPVADPPRRSWPWQRLAWVTTGAVLAAVALRMMLAPSELRSEASMLQFTPEQPAPGASVEVVYRATPRFAGLTELKLRARYRRAGDGPSVTGIVPVVAATLAHDGNGSYRATFELPPDVVYAAFAVEDMEGHVVDARGLVGWEILTYQDGLPLRDALLQSAYEATGRDLGLALERATRATELYPDLVAAWAIRSALERTALGSVASDSLRAYHLDRLRALHSSLRDTPVQPDLAESMYFFASTWDAREISDWWYERLLREWPRSPAAAQLRAVTIRQDSKTDPSSKLRAFEHLWVDGGARHKGVAQMAFEIAKDARNGPAAYRWAVRRLEIEPGTQPILAREMMGIPALRDTVLAWLSMEAAALERTEDDRRPLYRTVERQRQKDEQRRREVLGLMGRVALAGGNVEAAMALLDSATTEGWNLELIEAAADAHLEVGDISGGITMLARLAVDPAYVGPDPTARALSLVGPDEWAGQLDRARDGMIAATLGDARARNIARPVRVSDDNGTERELYGLIGGHVSVIAFFWPGCNVCVAELQQLQDMQRKLSVNTRVVLVSNRPILSSELEFLRAEGVGFPVVIDTHGDVADALEPWGRPLYFVVDRPGTVRFSYSSIQDISRQVLALAGSEPPVT